MKFFKRKSKQYAVGATVQYRRLQYIGWKKAISRILIDKLKLFGLALMFVLVGYGLFLAGQMSNGFEINTVVQAGNEFEEKLDGLKNDVVRRLSDECEFTNKKRDPLVIDSNGKGGQQVSIGDLQFTPKTVIHYYKVLYGDDIDYDKAIEIALDEEVAAKFAKDIIFQVDGGIWNWRQCAEKLDLAPDITVIKKLMSK